MASLPATSPFAEDQLAEIDRLLAGATPEQRVWLGGYVAGYSAANDKGAAPAAPPARKPVLTILYATESGNSEALALAAKKEAARLGLAPRVLDMADTSPAEIARTGDLLIIASTWGEGDAPQRAEPFMAELMAEGAPRFENARYAVLALGDRAYAKFCETGRQIDERFAALGAKRIAPRQECDVDYEASAKAWIGTTLREIGTEAGASVIHVDFMRPSASDESWSRSRPYEAEITASLNLNGSRSGARTYHVELSLEGSGLAYEPGDSLGFLPTNDPALVDDVLAAAGLADDALRGDLATKLDITALDRAADRRLCRADRRHRAQRARPGCDARARRSSPTGNSSTCSPPRRARSRRRNCAACCARSRRASIRSHRAASSSARRRICWSARWPGRAMAARATAWRRAMSRCAGASARALPVYVQPNRHFRLPQDAATPDHHDRPGHRRRAVPRLHAGARRRRGARGKSWLFFGARNFTHDFLYQLEWQDWLKDGVLSRMDVAFSRDQPEKIYVQHRMWEQRARPLRLAAGGRRISTSAATRRAWRRTCTRRCSASSPSNPAATSSHAGDRRARAGESGPLSPGRY